VGRGTRQGALSWRAIIRRGANRPVARCLPRTSLFARADPVLNFTLLESFEKNFVPCPASTCAPVPPSDRPILCAQIGALDVGREAQFPNAAPAENAQACTNASPNLRAPFRGVRTHGPRLEPSRRPSLRPSRSPRPPHRSQPHLRTVRRRSSSHRPGRSRLRPRRSLRGLPHLFAFFLTSRSPDPLTRPLFPAFSRRGSRRVLSTLSSPAQDAHRVLSRWWHLFHRPRPHPPCRHHRTPRPARASLGEEPLPAPGRPRRGPRTHHRHPASRGRDRLALPRRHVL